MKKIRYKNFWPSFDAQNSEVHHFFEFVLGETEIVSDPHKNVQIEIESVFQNRFYSRVFRNFPKVSLTNNSHSTKRVWYTGENIRAPFNEGFDLTLGFDQDSYFGTNAYLPLWYLLLDWRGKGKTNQGSGEFFNNSDLLLPRTPITPRESFACGFVGNKQSFRNRIFKLLSSIGETRTFGTSVGRPVKFKKDVSKNFTFMVCMENDLYPGYVTEKLFEAYISGCIPIYWGDLGKDANINRNCFINIADFEDLSSFHNYMKHLTHEEVIEISSQPF